MSDEEKKESVDAGSSEDLIQDDPFSPNLENEGGKSLDESKKDINLDNYVEKVQYEEAEKKIGDQGKELGEYRSWFKDASPLLDKLKAEPEVVEAIMSGKIDAKLAQSVLEGKVSATDANEVTEAQKEVKKELGTKKFKEASSEEIEKMITEKVSQKISEETKSLKGAIRESEDKMEFQKNIDDFVKNTPDFAKYADKIFEWTEEDKHNYDIRKGYEIIKGREIIDSAAKSETEKAAEAAKELAGNAAGGFSQGGKISEEKDLADDLISERSNPNVF